MLADVDSYESMSHSVKMFLTSLIIKLHHYLSFTLDISCKWPVFIVIFKMNF